MARIPWVTTVLWIFFQGNWLAGAQAPLITRQPSNTYAAKSGIAELICEANGTGPIKYKWYHNGQIVQSIERKRVLSNGHLYIKRFLHKKKKGISDTGEYYCLVSDTHGKKARSRTVNISLGHIRKEFRRHPVSQTISRGGRLTLTCNPPRAKPRPKLRWLKDERNVDVDGTRVLLEERSQKLIVKHFKKDDEGSYRCEATNVAGRILSNPAIITSTVAPTIVSVPKDKVIDISIYEETTLSCKANGVPSPKIIWKKKGNNTILPSVDGTLTLTKLKRQDIGEYICIAVNREGNTSATVNLMLHYIPEFTDLSSNVNEKEGSTVKLKCLANAEPSPLITWRKDNQPYVVNHWYGHIQAQLVGRTAYLIFKPLKISDAGNYTCEASNKIGARRRHINLRVYRKTQYAPNIATPQRKISADINSNATIICDVNGNPKPTVKWLKFGQDGVPSDGVIYKDEQLGRKHRYSLIINKVQQSDEGTYQCVAGNIIKSVSQNVVLQVSGKLRLSQNIRPGVPSMPKNVKVVEFNDRSACITWDRSDDYVIVYAVGYINVDLRSDEHYASRDVPSTERKYVVQGLKENTQYMFFVCGINNIGDGVPSLLSSVIRTKSASPTSPTVRIPTVFKPRKLKINLSSAGAGELVVSWDRLDGPEKYDGYYIYWKVKGERSQYQIETLQNNLSTRYKISDLQNSTTYSVYVQVFKGSFKGLNSTNKDQSTSKEPVTLKMSVTQNDSDSLTVTWKRLWKKNSGEDTLKTYAIWCSPVNNHEEARRRKRRAENGILIPASRELYHYIIGDLTPGASYTIWMSVATTLGRTYTSPQKSIVLRLPVANTKKSKMDQIKDFIIQPWFLGALGGVILLLILILLMCCICRRSSTKKDVDSIELQDANSPEAVRKAPSKGASAEGDALTPASRTGRESLSECGADDGRSSSVYRCSGSPKSQTRSDLDFSNIAITPNKYERMYRSLTRDDTAKYNRPARKYSENDFDSPSRYNQRARNPYSSAPKPSCPNIDSQSDYDNAKSKCESTPEPSTSRTATTRSPYPGEAPPDYETAISENCNEVDPGKTRNKESRNNYKDARDSHLPYKHDRYGNPSSRQSSCSPGSECSNQGSSIAGRRKGLKPLPRLTIASVNWADMLPPPPSHPPPSSVATRSPPPSPTATSMCSETTYGRSHASSFHPRRSGSVVSADMASDFEKDTADSVRSGKSKGKSENKLPFDLAGITSDIIMQWADSVTNTSGSDDESPCSSPDRRSGISSDGSFLTDTDFANAVKAAAECGGFNIDIDLNMYKAMDPISFQPFAGSLSTYNPETTSSIKPPSKKSVTKDGDSLRESSRGRRSRSENSRDVGLTSVKENSSLSVHASENKKNGKQRNVIDGSTNVSTGYVPALTRTSALGKLEPVNRGPVKKKYAIVKTIPQVQAEGTPDYTPNYPSHSLSSSTSNASTVRSSSCPPVMLSDEDTEDDVI